MSVVGVVENVRLDGLVDGPGFRTVGAYYMPMAQSPVRTVTLAVRTALAPTAVTGAIALAAIYSLLLILFRFSVEDKEALVSLLRPGRKRADETPLSD